MGGNLLQIATILPVVAGSSIRAIESLPADCETDAPSSPCARSGPTSCASSRPTPSASTSTTGLP